jgi:ankyrin repeat protein
MQRLVWKSIIEPRLCARDVTPRNFEMLENAGHIGHSPVRLRLCLLLCLFCLPACADINEDLINAVRKGDPGKVKHLLALGADANVTTSSGFRVLYIAAVAAKGSDRIVQELLNAGAQVNHVQKLPGNYFERVSSVSEGAARTLATLLLEKGADPNGRTWGDGAASTALAGACQYGNVQAAKELLQAGADPNLGDRNPLSLALNPMIFRTNPVSGDQGAKLVQFLKISALWSPIMRASWLGLDSVVQLLLEEGANLDDLQIAGMTAERLATDKGFPKIVERLAQALAAPGETIHLRGDALCAATEMELNQIARLLGSNKAGVARELIRHGWVIIDKGEEIGVLQVNPGNSRFRVMKDRRECWALRESVQR